MRNIINFILFYLTICSFAQTSSKTYDFKFYKNGEFKNSKIFKIQIVRNLDTITSEILNNKIIIPEIKDSCTIFFRIRNNKYIIENVDLSKLDSNSTIILGIENNIENLEPISNRNPNIYIIKNTSIAVKIENLEQAKKVNFIVFESTEITGGNSKKVKNYTQYFFSQKK